MKITPNLRAALTCLEQADRHFMEISYAAQQAKRAAKWGHPLNCELPQEFVEELRLHMDIATANYKAQDGQVYFFRTMDGDEVYLFEEESGLGYEISGGNVCGVELHGSGIAHAAFDTFTLGSLFH
jgi:hypothetical protein